MSGRHPGVEQRRAPRFRVSDDVYVMLRQPQYTELGKIVDISRTGLAFLCVNQGDWSSSPFEADILFNNESGGEVLDTLKGLPLRPIRYCRDEEPTGTHAGFTRCGVEFSDLTAEQQLCLNRFIREHACGHA